MCTGVRTVRGSTHIYTRPCKNTLYPTIGAEEKPKWIKASGFHINVRAIIADAANVIVVDVVE